MYLWCKTQDMPLGPGVKWTKFGNRFRKSIMTYQQSLGQVQWLQYLQESSLCLDNSGNRIQMEYGYYQGETEYDNLKPDGYMVKDGEQHFFEYLGNMDHMI